MPRWFVLTANLNLRLHGQARAYVYAALAVVAGNAHEDPILYELVEQFVRRVGPGVMKKLMLDRGFIDGPRIAYCKTVLGVDVLIPIKKKMDLWIDAWRLAKQGTWEPQGQPTPPPAPPFRRPLALEKREQKRQRTLAERRAQAPPPEPATVITRRKLCPIKGFRWREASDDFAHCGSHEFHRVERRQNLQRLP